MKRTYALLLAMIMTLSLCACGSNGSAQPSDSGSREPAADSPSPSESAAAQPSASLSPEEADAILSQSLFEYASGLKDGDTALTVNGRAIPNEVYFYWLSNYCYYIDLNYYYSGYAADFADPDLAAALKEYARDVIVYYNAVDELSKQNGIEMTAEQQADFQQKLDEALTAQSMDMETFLRGTGLSEESFRYLNTAEYYRQGLLDALVGEPTQEDLEDYADGVGLFSCKHILLMIADQDVTAADGTVTSAADHNAAQKALAEDLLAQIREADDPAAKFDELMHQYSEDTGLPAYPDGYTFTASDSLVPGFREATLELEPGEISDIVETAYGYHILLRLPADLSEYRDDVRSEQLEVLIAEVADSTDTVTFDGVASVDVAEFYQRYNDWYAAFSQMLDDTAGKG